MVREISGWTVCCIECLSLYQIRSSGDRDRERERRRGLTIEIPWRILSKLRDAYTFLLEKPHLANFHGSIVVSIPACHAGDRGSIPRRGEQGHLLCVQA